MDGDKTKVEVKDESSDEVDVYEKPKKSAFDGPMAVNPDDLTDRAIDDIARAESDAIIESEDERVLEAIDKKTTLKERISHWFHSWWDIPKKRYTVLGIAGFILSAILIFPPTRYALLNTVGVRATANIVVLDQSTGQPLKNVDVTIRGQTAQTNIDGIANLSEVKLGSTEVKVEKIAYAEATFNKTFGLGNNQLEDISLQPVGSQFSFEIIDWLSQKPIDRAEITFEESSALSDHEGKAVLTIEPTDETNIEATITAENYREQKFTLNTENIDLNKVSLKAGNPSYFVSNRSGNYDVYEIYPDEEPNVIVEGTGYERDDMRFAVSPDRKFGILVATRDDVRNSDGYLLSGLYKIDLETTALSKIDESEKIELVGWADGKLVYVKIAEGASGKNPFRHRLHILNLEDGTNKEVATSNYFNDVVVTNNQVFYAPSDAYKDNPDTALFKSDSQGNVSKIFDAEVWTITQTAYNELAFDATGTWYSYSITDDSSSTLNGPPNDRNAKVFVEGSGDEVLWVDQRDGKGVLLAQSNGEDRVIIEKSGLEYPVQWLTDKHLVFRVSTNEETADYIVNIEGGDAVKLTDVADISGTDRWYYY